MQSLNSEIFNLEGLLAELNKLRTDVQRSIDVQEMIDDDFSAGDRARPRRYRKTAKGKKKRHTTAKGEANRRAGLRAYQQRKREERAEAELKAEQFRKKMSEAQKKRWATHRKQQQAAA